jgi:hypothetical protein
MKSRTKKFAIHFILISLIGVLRPTICQGQVLLVLLFGNKITSEKFYLSLNGGLNLNGKPSFNMENIDYYPYFGLSAHVKLNNKLFFVPGFSPVSNRRVKMDQLISELPNTMALNNIKTKAILRYVDIPLLVAYNITPKMFVASGATVSILTKAQHEVNGMAVAGESITIDRDIMSNIIPVDFSIPIQIGYSIQKFRNGKGVNVIIDYSYGLRNVFKDKSMHSTHNSMLQVVLSFPFVKPPDASKEPK